MDAAQAPREIVILGSTGSIGTQAADVVRRNPDRFRIAGLAAGGGNAALLAAQAIEFGVDVVAVADDSAAANLELALRAAAEQAAPPAEARPTRAPGKQSARRAGADQARAPARQARCPRSSPGPTR